jgi:hypothetical protein
MRHCTYLVLDYNFYNFGEELFNIVEFILVFDNLAICMARFFNNLHSSDC